MFFKIDPKNGVPIYEQIVRQIVYAIADRMLQPGELVPSVREMARQMAINPNTVNRAYRELQSLSMLESVRGTGLQVTKGATEKCRRKRQKLIRERLGDVLREALQSRLSEDELLAMFTEEMQRQSRRTTKSREVQS